MNVRYLVDLTQDERASLDAIRGMFTVEKARKKMGRARPTLPSAALPLAA